MRWSLGGCRVSLRRHRLLLVVTKMVERHLLLEA
jgi:hypothetical protein